MLDLEQIVLYNQVKIYEQNVLYKNMEVQNGTDSK